MPPKEASELSALCRTSAKAACVFIADAALLVGVVQEQLGVLGEFPGPVPVAYRPTGLLPPAPPPASSPESSPASGDGAPAASFSAALQTAVLYGADALVVPLVVDPASLAVATAPLDALAKLALDAATLGVAIVPELILEDASALSDAGIVSEATVGSLVDSVSSSCGSGVVLVGALFSAALAARAQSSGGTFSLAFLKKTCLILGVVDVPPGEELLKPAVKALDALGFAGILLAASCAPRQLDMVTSGRFWSAACSMLRSKQSETFSVRLNAFTKEGANAPDAWGEYMQQNIDSGVAGVQDLPPQSECEAVDESKGDYRGFT